MLRSETEIVKREKRTRAISVRTVLDTNDRTGPAIREAGLCPVHRVKKFYVLIPMIVSFFAVHSFACQPEEPEKKAPPAAMTEEEKEMMNDREMLENLALLKDLDTIAFLDLLNEMDPEWSEKDESVLPEEEPEEKEEEGDKK